MKTINARKGHHAIRLNSGATVVGVGAARPDRELAQ